ncbi:MAG: glycogen debranching protein GlgX [Alphaproteobacteria bacterium]
MDPKDIRAEDGSPDVMGATPDGSGVNFALYSKHAARVELCLFDDDGKNEIARIDLPKKTGDTWHGYVPGMKAGQVYGYRVHGPYDPQQGHRFNPNKLVIDTYAKEIVGEVDTSAEEQSNPAKDNAAVSAKARVTEPLTSPLAPKPNTPWADTIIYELHPKGYSVADSKIPKELRGTYAGMASKASIDYLKDLGVTAVEIMPVHAKAHDSWLKKLGLGNFWGYNSLSFFAPEPEYAADKKNARQEFRDMVNTFHKSGIEVILDVVYNHAAEGNETGPTLSLRGVDNASYYKLHSDKSQYINDTGCGNTIDIGNPAVRKMILDSLRHWVEEYGIDGFRFDLATVLGRDPLAYDKKAAFFKELEADPALSKIKLIAEPWDPGPGGYQLGNFPKLWHEWNDRFRDDIRKFWRGTTDMLSWLATRLAGSSPEFGKDGRAPQASVNMVTCHDGMPLHDVVSHTYKKNLANMEDNRDGNNENYSANYGVEGDTHDPKIIAVREQQKRNMLATLFLSQGTPMLLAGDEHGNSQKGNNNAYCQDNKIGWIDWDDITAEGKKLTQFVKKLIRFRKDHAVLRADHFLTGTKKDAFGVAELTWINPEGREQTSGDWAKKDDKCLGALFNEVAVRDKKDGERLLTVFNSHSGAVDFKLPDIKGGSGWTRLLDTAVPEADDKSVHVDGKKYSIPARSTVVFVQKRD